MDEGIMQDGTRTVGTHGRAVSRNSVLYTTNGALNTVSSLNGGTAPDFILFQEIDTSSDRSWHVNQVSEAESRFWILRIIFCAELPHRVSRLSTYGVPRNL